LYGNEIDFLAPLYFVANGDDQDQTKVKSYINAYNPHPSNLEDTSNLGRCDLHGQRVPFADHNDPNTTDIKPGSTSFETASILFSAVPLADPGKFAPLPWECHFYPIVAGASVVVPSLKQFTGNSQPISVTYDTTYLVNEFASLGLAPNPGQVFLALNNPSASIKFSKKADDPGLGADKSGGLATPDMQFSHLSRALGPVSNSSGNITKGSFNPAEIFKDVAPPKILLFGTIPLAKVLKSIGGFDLTKDLPKLPRFISDAVTMFESLAQDIAAAQQIAPALASAIAANASSLALTPARVLAASSPGSSAATLTNDVENVKTDITNLTATDLGAVGQSL
jgi:hypothetical protein